AAAGPDAFLLVHVDTPLAVCEARDVKGMYALARAGRLKGFTGVDDPYEVPQAPDVVVHAAEEPPDACARSVLAALAERGFVELGPEAAEARAGV
ncbi:MAG: adenylyl-sulfate kinase, partial [Clostridia bacterium]|nr:adenylyl-sulfate kinase [Clostridia bacterium]